MKRNAAVLVALWCAAACVAGASASGAGERTRTFTVSKGGKLDVSIRGGNITVQSWEKDEVRIDIRDVDDDDNPGIVMSQNGSTITIEPRGGSWNDCSLDIRVPSRFDIRLQSSSGDMDIDGPLTGKIRGTTGGGNIRLGDLGGTIDMRTSGGDISCGDIGGDLDLNTSGGDITMGAVTGNVTVFTSGGDISVAKVGKKVHATTSGGNISIGDVGGEVVGSTSGGDITAGSVSGSATLETSGGNVVLRGASGTVRASSAGGDLQLENISGTLEGSTAGGNVVAALSPAKNGKSSLSTSGGDIRLLVPDGAKATVVARIHVSGWWRSQRDTYEIRSDFPMEKYEKDDSSHEIRATVLLNGGGERVTLEAVSGNIEIRKVK